MVKLQNCESALDVRGVSGDIFPLLLSPAVPISSVRLTTIPDSGDVEEGSEMSLICQVEDGTLPIRFLFYRKKGNENLVKNMTETKDLYAIYRVSKFSKQEDGGYFCVASNGAHKEVRSNTSDVRGQKSAHVHFSCLTKEGSSSGVHKGDRYRGAQVHILHIFIYYIYSNYMFE